MVGHLNYPKNSLPYGLTQRNNPRWLLTGRSLNGFLYNGRRHPNGLYRGFPGHDAQQSACIRGTTGGRL